MFSSTQCCTQTHGLRSPCPLYGMTWCQAPAVLLNLGVDVHGEESLASSGAGLKALRSRWTSNVKMPIVTPLLGCQTCCTIPLLKKDSSWVTILCVCPNARNIIVFHCRPSRFHMIPFPLPAPSLPSSSQPGTARFKSFSISGTIHTWGRRVNEIWFNGEAIGLVKHGSVQVLSGKAMTPHKVMRGMTTTPAFW